MKTKIKFSLLGLLFTNLLSVNAQTGTEVATINATAIGINNGALAPNGGGIHGTYVGYESGMNNITARTGADNTFVGHQSGRSTTMGNGNSFFGSNSGINNLSGFDNTFMGLNAGYLNSSGYNNTFIGKSAGYSNDSGVANVYLGPLSGFYNKGSYNIFIGQQAGFASLNSMANVFIGHGSGLENQTGWGNSYLGFNSGLHSKGERNVYLGSNSGSNNGYGVGNSFLGYNSGGSSTGSGNVFIGLNSGENETRDHKLIVEINNSSTPTIYGDFDSKKIGIGGINTNYSTADGFPATAGGVNLSNYKLFVKGGILTEEVRVSLGSTWADYVFNKDYNLKPLSEVEKFINDNGHLPNVPSAKQVKEEGIELGNMSKIQQEKIEELTLYVIQQNKNTEGLTLSLIQQKKEIEELKAQLKVLIEKNK